MDGHEGVAQSAAELGGEGRGHLALADDLGPLGIGNVEDLEAAAGAAQIREIVVGAHIGEVDEAGVGVVALPAVPLLFAGLFGLIAEELAGVPPAANFHRVRGVCDVHDAVDEILEADGCCRQMQIPAAVIAEPVHAAAPVLGVAGGPKGELLRVLGIFLQREDVHAAGSGLIVLRRGAVEELQAVAVGDDQQVVCHLALGGGHIGILLRVHHRHILHMAGIGGIGDVQDLHAVAVEAAAVEVILSVRGLVDLGLEQIMIVAVVVREHLHVFDVALVAGALRIELLCHDKTSCCENDRKMKI